LSGEPILIAALSGRALAASARRAGYVPLVVDAFGDADTRALAGDARAIAGALRKGFGKAELLRALDEMAQAAGSDPIGLILGPGFEDSPKLVGELAKRYRLMGCAAETVARANDPKAFFALLADLGIEHPATVFAPPQDTQAGWLSKRAGACGGRHIRRLGRGKAASAAPRRYFQKEVEGGAFSAFAITGACGTAFAFTRSWCAPRGREPYRFGGIVSADELDADLEARLIDTCLALINPLQLVGVVSFDFIVSGSEALLLEVNPRPGASLDVLDDAGGTLFKAHISACRGEDAVEILARQWRPKPHACAYLYADKGAVEVGEMDWPGWVSDVPPAGQRIEAGAPIATVHAEADNAELAQATCAKRLEKLAGVVYGSQNDQDN